VIPSADHPTPLEVALSGRTRDDVALRLAALPDNHPSSARYADERLRSYEVRAPDAPAIPEERSDRPDISHRQETTVERVAAECDLEGDAQLGALRDAYDLAHEYLGPLVVKAARDMLPDLRADVEQKPGTRVAFVGRDGFSLATAVRALDQEFYKEHCSVVVLSRVLVETAVQDLETRSGRVFPEIAGFRGAAEKVGAADTMGAYQQLTEYLRHNGISAGQPDGHVTLVDTSYKGTVQELLSAIYPETALTGRYLFFAASPDDPHPGTKFGYALHLEGEMANGGLPVMELPADPALTFAHQDAIGAVEETLHGADGSPKRMLGGQPELVLGDHGLVGFNPLVVSPRYSEAPVRAGVLRVTLSAVADFAVQAAEPDSPAAATLDVQAEAVRGELRGWIAGGATDPRLREFLDSFVRRTDKRAAAQVTAVIHSAELDPARIEQVWIAFGRCTTLAEKDAFVGQFARTLKGAGSNG
jgi:hypothetical protein